MVTPLSGGVKGDISSFASAWDIEKDLGVKRTPSGDSRSPSMCLRTHRVRIEIPPNTVRRDREPERFGSDLTEEMHSSGLPEALKAVYGFLMPEIRRASCRERV